MTFVCERQIIIFTFSQASGLGESSCRVWGYMGLDGTPGTQVDNFKLSFEDQTEKRVK